MRITKLENMNIRKTVFGEQVLLPSEMDGAELLCITGSSSRGGSHLLKLLLPHQLYVEDVNRMLEQYDTIRVLAVNNILEMVK